MKNESGVTLISLIVYVILITFVIAGVTAITTTFYNNVSEVDKNAKGSVDFAKFNMYFLKDIKSEESRVVSHDINRIQILLRNNSGEIENVTYSIQNQALYRNKVKICDNVNKAEISAGVNAKNSDIIHVHLKINDYDKTTTYIIEPRTKIEDPV